MCIDLRRYPRGSLAADLGPGNELLIYQSHCCILDAGFARLSMMMEPYVVLLPRHAVLAALSAVPASSVDLCSFLIASTGKPVSTPTLNPDQSGAYQEGDVEHAAYRAVAYVWDDVAEMRGRKALLSMRYTEPRIVSRCSEAATTKRFAALSLECIASMMPFGVAVSTFSPPLSCLGHCIANAR